MTSLMVVHVDKGWAWGAVLAGFIANLITGGLAKSFGIVMKEYQDVFDCPSAYVTLAGGLIYTFMYSTSIVVHVISTRIGARLVVAFGAVGATFCIIGASFSESVALWVTVIGVGLGISLSCIYFSAFVVVGQCFDRRLGLANGLSVAGVSVGQIVFPSIVSFLIEEFTIRGATLIAGAVVFHLLIASVLMPSEIIRETPEKSDASTHDTELDGSAGDKKEEKKEDAPPAMDWILFAVFTVAKIFSDVGDVGLSIIFPPMGREIGLSNRYVGLAIACGGAVDLVSRLVIGYLSDRKGCKRSMILLAAWIVEAVNGIVMANCNSLPVYFACYIVFGVCSGTAMALMIVVLTDFVTVFHLPKSFAIMMVSIGVVLTPGQFVLGLIEDKTGTYRWSIVVGSTLVFLGAVVLVLEYPIRIWRRRRFAKQLGAPPGQQELTPIAGDCEADEHFPSKQPEFHTSRSSLHIIANANLTDEIIG